MTKHSKMMHGITFVDNGHRVAIAKLSRIWTQLVYMTDGGRVVCKRIKGTPKFREIKDMTLKKLAIKLLKKKTSLGTKKHITQSAKTVLMEAKRLR